MDTESPAAPLFVPPDAGSSRCVAFLKKIRTLTSTEWSTDHIDLFWDTVWDDVGIVGYKGQDIVDNNTVPATNPPWFSEARINWAENMLTCRSADKFALIQATEPTPECPNPPHQRVTYADLYAMVADLVSALLILDLKPGDRVASYSSNCIENVVACLAATAIGCIWVSAAADFGTQGVLERFEQIQPRVIFAVDAVVDVSLNPVVIVIQSARDVSGWDTDWVSWDTFISKGKSSSLGRTPEGEIEWCRQGFDWPLWILFSSGTTGVPIVHRAGGMLLQAKKEFVICADLRPADVFFYYTTTGWMMWNFLVSGLSVGCTLVLYDGSPLREPSYLWCLVDELQISIFGTSAKYLDQLSRTSYKPRDHHNLACLRHIYSTGSPLAHALFDYVYECIHPNVLLASITGGTDICSLFAGMCSALPVHRGEIQCRMLGMAIETFTHGGHSCQAGEAGELVCVRPFPCMPIGFWPLPGFGTDESIKAAAERFRLSYFAEYEDVWYHGDHVLITPSQRGNGGGLIMLGRSDGVLNPGGIRFGSSEIYNVLETCFSFSEERNANDTIEDALVVAQSIEGGADERVILFQKIRSEIRSRRSPRHVPARIIQIDDIPYTLNGKRVEIPVQKAQISSVNSTTLRNPECLAQFASIGEMLRKEISMALKR
ncbi:hypothetical protein EDB19DRAFT_1924945 [Suillus lakei]|nr:hypothetical protein EDB19DRAFT_1924945 [Suillus lakei]